MYCRSFPGFLPPTQPLTVFVGPNAEVDHFLNKVLLSLSSDEDIDLTQVQPLVAATALLEYLSRLRSPLMQSKEVKFVGTSDSAYAYYSSLSGDNRRLVQVYCFPPLCLCFDRSVRSVSVLICALCLSFPCVMVFVSLRNSNRDSSFSADTSVQQDPMSTLQAIWLWFSRASFSIRLPA